MSTKQNTIKSMTVVKFSSIFLGSLITIWSSAAILSGLSQVNWQVSELLRQYLVAVGLMQEFHTMSDFYTHIKGVEYIIKDREEYRNKSVVISRGGDFALDWSSFLSEVELEVT